MNLHPSLSQPLRGDRDSYVRDLLLDLTVYLDRFDVPELEALVLWYRRLCPSGRLTKYIVEDITMYDDLRRLALLTKSGRAAQQAGDPYPYLASVRKRIQDGRRYWLQFWDGQPTASWSLCIRSMHLEQTGLHTFVRLMVPIDTNVAVLHQTALEWADLLDIKSGHGGLAFTYDPWQLRTAFNSIYVLAKRFWGVDVEHLTGTLPQMKERIKGVSWLTLMGSAFRDIPEINAGLAMLAPRTDMTIDARRFATVIRLGNSPVSGDQNRPDGSLVPYEDLAKVLEPIYLDAHPDFPGDSFYNNANTVGWVRRFLDPNGWR